METYRNPESLAAQELIATLKRPQPTVIAVEGGPCSGKTTLVERLRQASTDRPIVVLPEAASQAIDRLLKRGLSVAELAKYDRPGFLQFETEVLGAIMANIETAQRDWSDSQAIIVSDRCDIGAYLEPDEYNQILAKLGRRQPPMLGMVDQLYYLPSVALESPELYDRLKSSNAARYESLDQAQATCRANLQAVARHPELHVAWGGDFDLKLDGLVDDIVNPERETELALEYVDPGSIIQDIKSAYRAGRFLSRARIEQSYHRLDSQEFRLRRTVTDNDESIYGFTIKTGEGLERQELQRRIDESDYDLLRRMPQAGRTLHKTRYEFLQPHPLSSRGWRKWTADYYDEPHLQRWQAEVELRDTSQEELFPWSMYTSGNRVARPTAVRARDLADV